MEQIEGLGASIIEDRSDCTDDIPQKNEYIGVGFFE
jgi:hypothetical protein